MDRYQAAILSTTQICFCIINNFGTESMEIHIVRAIVENECLRFKEEIITTY